MAYSTETRTDYDVYPECQYADKKDGAVAWSAKLYMRAEEHGGQIAAEQGGIAPTLADAKKAAVSWWKGEIEQYKKEEEAS